MGHNATLIEVLHGKNNEKAMQATCYALHKGFGGNAVCPAFDRHIPVDEREMRHHKQKYVTLYLVVMGENSTLDQLKAYNPFNFSYGEESEPRSINPKLITVRAHYPIAAEPGLLFHTLGMFIPAGLQYFSLKTAGPTLVKRLVTEMLIELYNSYKEGMSDEIEAEIKEYEFIINWRCVPSAWECR
jgi:hypothetical protein